MQDSYTGTLSLCWMHALETEPQMMPLAQEGNVPVQVSKASTACRADPDALQAGPGAKIPGIHDAAALSRRLHAIRG